MKAQALKRVCGELAERLEALRRAVIEAHEAATDPGSRAESKYDTRSLEQAYLASGQARQLEEMSHCLDVLLRMELRDFAPGEVVDAGALVEVEGPGGRAGFLLVPAGGGLEVVEDGLEITLLTPDSPLYGKLSGMGVGDRLDQPPMRVVAVR